MGSREQVQKQHIFEIKKEFKMISKTFAILLFSVIAICNCQYLYHHMGHGHSKTNMVWFKVDEPEGCKEAPEEVSSEELPKDICADAAAKDRQCFCIGWNTTTWHGFEEGLKSTENITYFPWCGECIDPCALRFKSRIHEGNNETHHVYFHRTMNEYCQFGN